MSPRRPKKRMRKKKAPKGVPSYQPTEAEIKTQRTPYTKMLAREVRKARMRLKKRKGWPGKKRWANGKRPTASTNKWRPINEL